METIKTVQSVDRAIAILRCFSLEHPELKLAEIATLTGLNKSTAYGILSTLRLHGFIEQNEDTQRYRLGLSLLELGETVLSSMDILKLAAPLLEKLSDEFGETVHLAVLEGTEVVYIYKHDSKQSIRIVTTVGGRNPAYCTGVGKVLLANQDSQNLMKHLPKTLKPITPKTIVDKHALLDQLRMIKETGYATDKDEIIEGVSCVAVPVHDNRGKVRYALSVTGPSQRMGDAVMARYIGILKKHAHELSTALGYRGQK